VSCEPVKKEVNDYAEVWRFVISKNCRTTCGVACCFFRGRDIEIRQRVMYWENTGCRRNLVIATQIETFLLIFFYIFLFPSPPTSCVTRRPRARASLKRRLLTFLYSNSQISKQFYFMKCHSLIHGAWALLEKLPVLQTLKKFPAFYGT
jgi:hypothetical protein